MPDREDFWTMLDRADRLRAQADPPTLPWRLVAVGLLLSVVLLATCR